MIFLAVALDGGSAEVVNGTYELTDHGKLIRYLTEEEYLPFTNYESKFFSSSWLMFYRKCRLPPALAKGGNCRVLRDTSRAVNRCKETSGRSWKIRNLGLLRLRRRNTRRLLSG